MDSSDNRVLVTAVPGRVGGVGSAIVDILRLRDLPVRALVLREDQRTDALRVNGVDVVVGDLTQARDVAGALSVCRRMYVVVPFDQWRDQVVRTHNLSC